MARERLVGDIDSLIEEVERAVREVVEERELTESIDDLVSRVSEVARNAVTAEKAHDFSSVEREVRLAVRSVVGEERLGEDADSLADRVTKAVRGAFGRGSELAGSVGQSLKERIRAMVDGVRGTGRESVVMVRVNRESQERMDELVEVGLVGSRSEAAAYLIAEGIKSSEDLFSRISSKIDDIRKAKKELDRILNEKRVPNA